MLRGSIGNSLWLMAALRTLTSVALLLFACGIAAQDNGKPPSDQPAPVKPWVAPADARKVKNPVPVTPEGLAAAVKLFQDNCALCHGEKGQGDGEGGKTLNRKPANFTDKTMMSAE